MAEIGPAPLSVSGTAPKIRIFTRRPMLVENLNPMENNFCFEGTTRREVLRKAAFVTPLILTLPVLPSFAQAGSSGADDGDDDNGGGGSASGRRHRHHCGFWCHVFGQ